MFAEETIENYCVYVCKENSVDGEELLIKDSSASINSPPSKILENRYIPQKRFQKYSRITHDVFLLVGLILMHDESISFMRKYQLYIDKSAFGNGFGNRFGDYSISQNINTTRILLIIIVFPEILFSNKDKKKKKGRFLKVQ